MPVLAVAKESKLRRALIIISVVCAIGVNAPSWASSPVKHRLGGYSGPVILPTSGALFGAYLKLDAHNGMERREAITNFETLIGRPIAIDRVYYNWTDNFPNADDYWSRDQGHILFLSWNAGYGLGQCAKWADIAAGLYDADIDAKAAALMAFGSPMIFSFHHEPTTHNPGEPCGTPDEYKLAWRHVRERFDANGVTNLSYALTLTAQSFDKNNAEPYYPGDDVIDIVAADGYNWYSCQFHPGPWRSIEQIFSSFHDFGVSHGKPMVIAEYGSGEDDALPGRKAQWFTDGADILKRWPEIKGISYFNVGNGGACDRYVDTSPDSLAAFRTMGFEPYFNPPVAVGRVLVADFSFSPTTVTIDQGTGVVWSFDGPSDHTVTSSGDLGLFDSGAVSAGGTFSFFFVAAGNYRYNCTIHPSMQGTVKVPALADPPTGGIDTEFTLTWSAELAPTGWGFDVQIRRPGQARWSNWLTLQTANAATFVPDGGLGTYSFRARLHNTVNQTTSKYSPPVQIEVA